jgi:hypothetical protein
MSMTKKDVSRRLQAWLCVGLLGGLFCGTVSAASQEITAVFRPDPANPNSNKFINTTPISSMCTAHIPLQCQQLGIFSLRDESFIARSNAPMLVGAPDPRKGAMFKAPSDWRNIQVTHTGTGETVTLELRIAGLGSRWVGPHVGNWRTAGQPDPWIEPPGLCQRTGFFPAGVYHAGFFWIHPPNAGACTVHPTIEVPQLRYVTLEYGYELRTPNPLTMSTGQYVGSTSYTMMPGGDFDFGDIMIPDDNLMTFNFTLDVQHTLKIDVPPGGNRVELEPQGGWHAWLQQGRKPTRLFRDQPFHVSASSRFKMNLGCEYTMDSKTCSLRDQVSGHDVPLLISVSLPRGLSDMSGGPIERRRLFMDGSGTEMIQPDFYLERKPATLHFEIPASEVASMIDTGRVRQYSGNVTVIWDSEI